MKYLLAGIFCLFWANFIFAAEKIDINTAPLEDLTMIIHVGEARAQELISLRPFSSLDELTKIRGIGEARLNDIKKQGLAWVDGNFADVGSPQVLNSTESSSNLTRSSSTPDVQGKQPPINHGDSLLLPTAIFTSFAGGAIILILKRKTHVRT